MVKLVIFDLDQTLINTLPRFYRIFNQSLEKFRCEPVEWDVFVRKYHEDTLNNFVCVDVKTFWDYFLRHYNDIPCEEDKLIDGALETLKRLKDKGIKVVITTGRIIPREKIWEELRKYGIDIYVDEVFTRYDYYGDGKRRNEMLLHAMEEFHAKPKETIFVGDYWPDMVSGKEAGVFTVGVLTGHENEEKLKKYGADVVIESVAELFNVIDE